MPKKACCAPFGKDVHTRKVPRIYKISENWLKILTEHFPEVKVQKGDNWCLICEFHAKKEMDRRRPRIPMPHVATLPEAKVKLPRTSILDAIVKNLRPKSKEAIVEAAAEFSAATERLQPTLRLSTASRCEIPATVESLLSAASSTSSSMSTNGSVYTVPSTPKTKADSVLAVLGVSPLATGNVRSKKFIADKGERCVEILSETLSEATGTSVTPRRFISKECRSCKKLLEGLVSKFAVEPQRLDKYRILTCVPPRFTINDILENFNGCKKYMAKVASVLRSKEGPYSAPQRRLLGHYKVQDHVRQKVIEFYLSPENSKIQAGLRETVLVDDLQTGRRERVAKHLMLCSQSELYLDFKTKFPDVNISLTSVAILKPKQCRWPGSKGFPQTCLCIYHSNFELLLQAVGCKDSVSELLQKVLCLPTGQEDCYYGTCSNCPNPEAISIICNSTSTVEEVLHFTPQNLFPDTSEPHSSTEACFQELVEEGHEEVQHAETEEAEKVADDDDIIEFYQWTSQERCNLTKLSCTRVEVGNMMKIQVTKLAKHHYNLQKQQTFFKNLELKIKTEEAAIVHKDFAENYSFVVRDEIQGFHWTNNQMTIHPFYVMWYDETGENLRHKSYIVFSDCLDHNANTIESFQRKFLPRFQNDLPNIKKIYYVSDGTGAQYKNYKSFSNLMFHEREYGIKVETHFTVSYHGKSQCDAMSAVTKRTLRTACYRDNVNILKPLDAFQYCQKKFEDKHDSMEFIFVTKEEVLQNVPELEKRYENCKTIPGTRDFHCFIPVNETQIEARKYSSSPESKIFDFALATPEVDNNFAALQLGSYIAYRTPTSFNIGLVQEIIRNENDVNVLSMRRRGKGNNFQWPSVEKELFVANNDIICSISVPQTTTGMNYTLETSEYAKVINLRNQIRN